MYSPAQGSRTITLWLSLRSLDRLKIRYRFHSTHLSSMAMTDEIDIDFMHQTLNIRVTKDEDIMTTVGDAEELGEVVLGLVVKTAACFSLQDDDADDNDEDNDDDDDDDNDDDDDSGGHMCCSTLSTAMHSIA